MSATTTTRRPLCRWCEATIRQPDPDHNPTTWVDEQGSPTCPLRRVTLYHAPQAYPRAKAS